MTATGSPLFSGQDTAARVRALLSNAPILLWALDPHGFLTLSEGRLLEKLGVQPGEHLGMSLRDLYKNHPQVLDAAERALAGQSIHEKIALGSIVIDTRYTPLYDADGRFAGTLGVGTDATDQVRLEEQIRQSEKMESVGRLAGAVAHDFNNLLTVIGSFAALAIEALDSLPDVRADVEQIQRAAESASRLTGQLLAFSRRQIVQLRTLDLNAEIARIAPTLGAPGDHVEVVLTLDSNVSKVNADPRQLDQVITNLWTNARDSMPGGGRLTVATSNVTLDAAFAASHYGTIAGDYVSLAVSDTGPGLNDAGRRSIFEPFFSTDASKGAGLGLAMVYGIVKQSGGSVWVESEPGRGTTFRVYLPIPPDAAEAAAKRRRVEPGAGYETILVVEDQPAVRTVVKRMLEPNGYRVLLAETGAEAIEISRTHLDPIQLLLTDMVMPTMSGRDLAATLRAERPSLRVLYMSGYSDDVAVRQGLLTSGHDFVQKPFTSSELLEKIRRTIDTA